MKKFALLCMGFLAYIGVAHAHPMGGGQLSNPAPVYTWRSDATNIHIVYQDLTGGTTSGICSRVPHYTGAATVYKMALAYPTWAIASGGGDTAFPNPHKFAFGIEYPATLSYSNVPSANFYPETIGGQPSATVAGGGSAGVSPLTGLAVSGQVIGDPITFPTPIPPHTEFFEQNCIYNTTSSYDSPASSTLGSGEGTNYSTIAYYNSDPIANNSFLGGASFTPTSAKLAGFFADAIVVYESAAVAVVLEDGDSKTAGYHDGQPQTFNANTSGQYTFNNIGAPDLFGNSGEVQRYLGEIDCTFAGTNLPCTPTSVVGQSDTSRPGDSLLLQSNVSNLTYRMPLWGLINPTVIDLANGFNDNNETQTQLITAYKGTVANLHTALPNIKIVGSTVEPGTTTTTNYWENTSGEVTSTPFVSGGVIAYLNNLLMTNPTSLGITGGVVDMSGAASTGQNTGIMQIPSAAVFTTTLVNAIGTSDTSLTLAAAPPGCPYYPPFLQAKNYVIDINPGGSDEERVEVDNQLGATSLTNVIRGYYGSTVNSHAAGETVAVANIITVDGIHLNTCGVEGLDYRLIGSPDYFKTQ